MAAANKVAHGRWNGAVALHAGDDEDGRATAEAAGDRIGHRLERHFTAVVHASKVAEDLEVLLVAGVRGQVGQAIAVDRQGHGIAALEEVTRQGGSGDAPHFQRILQHRTDASNLASIEENEHVGDRITALFVDHQFARACESLPVDALERITGDVFPQGVEFRSLAGGAERGRAGVHLRRSASKEGFLDVLDLREDDDVGVVVDPHFVHTEVERVAMAQGHGSDGVVAPERAAQHVTDSGRLTGLEVEAHLVQAASQLHLVRHVVEDLEGLRAAQ